MRLAIIQRLTGSAEVARILHNLARRTVMRPAALHGSGGSSVISGIRVVALMKEHGWALNLAFIALGSYFVAGAANAVVARTIRVIPSIDDIPADSGRSTKRKPQRHEPAVVYSAIANRNLFGAKREILDPVPDSELASEETELGAFDPDDLRACSMPASLRGTLVAEGTPEWSMAVVYINADREPNVFSASEGNDQIADDVTLVEVRHREIVVRRRDHYELCKAEGEGGAKAPASRSSAKKGSTDSKAGGVTKTSDTEYEIEREVVDNALSNLSQVATKARIVPSFKNGKPNGFKLFSIKPGSIFSKIGLQNGDVIQKINGYEINSPDKALEIYQKLKQSTGISIDLQRRGRAKSFSYSIN